MHLAGPSDAGTVLSDAENSRVNHPHGGAVGFGIGAQQQALRCEADNNTHLHAWHYQPAAPVWPRRRSDRIAPVSAAAQNVRLWHKADITQRGKKSTPTTLASRVILDLNQSLSLLRSV
jgi:hypothetical protein